MVHLGPLKLEVQSLPTVVVWGHATECGREYEGEGRRAAWLEVCEDMILPKHQKVDTEGRIYAGMGSHTVAA